MSAPVDVLAVMGRDAAAAHVARHGDTEIQEFLGKESQEARAAVAELIEAAQAVENSCVRHDANDADLFRRLDAALARVKGGAA